VSDEREIALDACVLLNLVASGRALAEFAAAVSARLVVVTQVEREILWIDPLDPDGDRERVDLDPIIAGGDLHRVVMVTDELSRFVALARELDDGEAATLAVAESRRMVVATDDRKALRIVGTLTPQPAVVSTAGLVRAWASGRDGAQVSACLRQIERRASFTPPASDPDTAWWRASTG